MGKRGQRDRHALFGKADLHIHSLASDGLNSPKEILDYVETETNLDVIAIADHDEIEGALEARALWQEGHYSFDVVVAEEVTTRSGHLLAIDIKTCVRMLQSLEKTIADIRSQGGLVVIPHPLAWYSSGLRRWRIEKIMQDPSPVLHFDGLETFIPSEAGRAHVNADAAALAAKWSLAHFGGSDSHGLHTIGTGRTVFPGHRWVDLRLAIEQRTTQSEGEFWAVSDYVRSAIPQTARAFVLLPVKRVKRMAGWFFEDRGYLH